MHKEPFAERSVLVTGGTTGIGLSVARAFVDAGARVFAPSPMELDVTVDQQVADFVQDLPDLYALINCAGVIRRDEEFEIAAFQQVLDINLSGTMRMCNAARPLLSESNGSIVNMASMLSFFGGPRVPAYSASKGAVVQLTKSLAAAWAADGIRVNAVAPGWIATAFTEAIQNDAHRSAQILSPHSAGALGSSRGGGKRSIILVFAICVLYHRGRPPCRWRVLRRMMNTHPLAAQEIVQTALPEDERIWVPQAKDVWFRPLMLNTVAGQWCNLLRVRKAGILSRHRHPAPVHGYVIKGSWKYLEHDWTARAGDYVFEPPGETHTLTVPDDVEEMITFFNISGCMYYVDEQGRHTGFEDVFTKIDMCRAHYEACGLGKDFVDRFIR